MKQMCDGHKHSAEAEGSAEGKLSSDVVATLVANHREFLAYLERRVSSRAVAEDILQEAFVRGLEWLESLRADESAVAWFYRSLLNAVVDCYRRHASADRALASFAREIEAEESVDDELREAVCQCVKRLAATLKPEYATALSRIEVDGQPVKDYADEIGISSSNAAVRVFRAREALRRQVAASCGTCAEHGCLDCTCSQTPERGHAHG